MPLHVNQVTQVHSSIQQSDSSNATAISTTMQPHQGIKLAINTVYASHN